MERRLSPGTRLPEEKLAATFGVSRTIVRQALQRLVQTGLCDQAPNRSVRVAEPTVDEVHHLYQVRRLLECSMISEAAAPLSRPQAQVLDGAVAQEAAANAKGQGSRAMKLADAFHLELAAAIGNPLLRGILGELIARANVALALYEQPGRASCRCDEHARILKFLKAGDRPRAAAEMRAHLTAIEQSLVRPRGRAGACDFAAIFTAPRLTPQEENAAAYE